MSPSPIKKSQRLKLSPRAHTGHKLHKSHTSYPLLSALLLMVGVLLLTTTLRARADTITVTATANGAPPTVAPVILSPTDDQHFTTYPLPVSGTCPVGFYIKLFHNNIFSGSAACASDGTFVIETDLFEGRNDLQARVYNIADVEGPRSNIVPVYYDIPVIPGQPTPDGGTSTPGSGPATPSNTVQNPFYLTTDYFYKAAFTGQAMDWDFGIHGGTSPYTIRVVWGDGYSDTIEGHTGNEFTLHHEYKVLKSQRDYFTVKVQLTDANGHRASIQLIAIMNDKSVIGGAQTTPEQPSAAAYGSWLLGKLRYVWSVYGFVLLMGVCFWLGERRGSSITASFYRKRRRTA